MTFYRLGRVAFGRGSIIITLTGRTGQMETDNGQTKKIEAETESKTVIQGENRHSD